MRMERNFGDTAPYTVGIEEEFQLVDPTSLALVPAIDAILAARGASELPEDSIASELSASCVELRSPVYGTVAELAADLPSLRRRLRALVEGCGARLAAAGAHPFSKATAQQITGKERYRKVDREMGWPARMQAIYGLHVHVAVPDEEWAIQAVAALSSYVPIFVALSANSPFWNGMDTRFASARVKIRDASPRSGLPPTFSSWEEFEEYTGALVAMGNIPDFSWFWWDVRPHPRLGTVELRVPDVQAEPDYVAPLAALTQCLVVTAEDTAPADARYVSENKWRAIRRGLDARFYDFATKREIEARKMARDLVTRLHPVSQSLGCEAELAGILEIVHRGTGADLQRAVYEKHGSLEDVVDYLIETTAPV
jgi:carboxylate-amine ligase